MSKIEASTIANVLTTTDVMARLTVSRKTLYVLVAKHLPNAARIGRCYRFIEEDINTIWNGMRSAGGQRATDGTQRRAPKGAGGEGLQQLLVKQRRKRS
jgi:excisionase family DNA binding protein